MVTIPLLFLVTVFAADPAAETHNQKLDRLHAAAKANAASKIAELEVSTVELAAEVKQMRRAKIVPASAEPPKTFASKKDREVFVAKQKAKLAADQAELKRLKESGELIPTIQTPRAVGDIGLWPVPWFNTEQVISPTEVICSRRDGTFLLRGVPTADMADGKTVIHPAAVYEVSGTYTYQTASGAPKTIPVVEPFKLERE